MTSTAPLARGLYAIVDVARLAARGLDPLSFTRAVLVASPAAVQIRAKELAAPELLGLLRAAGSLCREAGVPIVANDRVDLAVLAGCTHVHVGQDDLSIDGVRRVAPGLRVGVSTHTRVQLESALRASPDYVAYGPVFPTTSKIDPDPCVGLEGLAHAKARATAAGVALVAIGGITVACAPDVARLATAGAVIHALLPSSGGAAYEEVTARAIALHTALGGFVAGSPVVRA